MIRKAFVLVLSVIICCSLYAADRITYAVNGACSGVVSALVSQLSDPRISLQGVTVSSDSPDGWNVSFVRSDVSTYRSSLRFFAGPDRSAYLDSIWAGLAGVLSEGNPFFFDEIAEGEVILDGRMRFALDEDGLSVDVSLLVTGSAVESGVVIEGDFDISIEGSSAVISSGEVTIDGDEYELPSFGFTLPESGGSNG